MAGMTGEAKISEFPQGHQPRRQKATLSRQGGSGLCQHRMGSEQRSDIGLHGDIVRVVTDAHGQRPPPPHLQRVFCCLFLKPGLRHVIRLLTQLGDTLFDNHLCLTPEFCAAFAQ